MVVFVKVVMGKRDIFLQTILTCIFCLIILLCTKSEPNFNRYLGQSTNIMWDNFGCVSDFHEYRSLSTDEKVKAVHNVLTHTLEYDYEKARTIKKYYSDIERTYATKQGICMDFAILTASILRELRVQTKVILGDFNGGYHAWNVVLVDGEWQTIDITRSLLSPDIIYLDKSDYLAKKEYN